MKNDRIHSDIISFLASHPEMLQLGEGQYPKDGESFPSPRAWEMCSKILQGSENEKLQRYLSFNDDNYTSNELMKISKGFNIMENDIYTLIRSKIGTGATDAFQAFREDENNFVGVKDILTGKESKIRKDVKSKLENMSILRKNILSRHIIKYVEDNYDVFENDTSSEGVKFLKRFNSQFTEYYNGLEASNKSDMARRLIESDVDYDMVYDTIGDEFNEHYSRLMKRKKEIK